MTKPIVLIIDDDPALRKTLSDILKVKGFEAVAAKDGGEGLALLRRKTFSVVLIDLMLPDMSGIEILERVKKDHPSTEAIILTGNATLDSAIGATNMGAFSYLVKPYDIDQLILQVRRAVEKQQAEEKITSHSNELERVNAELRALYEISVAVSRTIDLENLFSEVLRVITGVDVFGLQEKGAIFLIKEERLYLAYATGLSDAELGPCKSVRRGDCLCGLAAGSGEIVISRDSMSDPRHSVYHPGEQGAHGHIVVPLGTSSKIVGVLCLYLKPDFDPGEQVLRHLFSIGNQIGIAVENAKLYEEAKSSSFHDSLTGLGNRRLLQLEMEKGLNAAKRYGKDLSVIMVDIDHFKKYNDAHGHIEGDNLLAAIASILMREARSADHVFRYGGEEFLIMLPETEPVMARIQAERIRRTVEAETPVTISLGIASYQDSGEKDLINNADAALYMAKQRGRNRVEVCINPKTKVTK